MEEAPSDESIFNRNKLGKLQFFISLRHPSKML